MDAVPKQVTGERLKEWAKQAKPYLGKVEKVIREVWPYCVAAHKKGLELYVFVKPYHTDDVAEIGLAVALLFFGGHFAMTIACWQAFQLTGSRQISKSWAELKSSYESAKMELEKDADAKKVLDSDGDGKIGPSELIMGLSQLAYAKTEDEKANARVKLTYIMKCIDPNKILDASIGLWTGLVAVLATLRSRFVHCVSIGTTIGKRIGDAVTPHLQPRLYGLFPEHKRWVDFGIRSGCGTIAVITSLLLIRVISAFNSALQGSALLVSKLRPKAEMRWPSAMKGISEDQMQMVIWAISIIGFLWQLKMGFNLPFLLKLPLLPLTLMEGILGIFAMH